MMSNLGLPKHLRVIFLVVVVILPSCATQKPTVEETTAPLPEPEEAAPVSPNAPPTTTFKNDKQLALVRAMEGGACNGKDQGAKGVFLVYAEPNDVERIKNEKGSDIFRKFETEIERFSLEAFQKSVAATNIADNPFALDDDDAQQQVAKQLKANFETYSAPAIEKFESSSGLTVDVVPFSPSMVFLLTKCNEALNKEPE